jgi:hypothetical protein
MKIRTAVILSAALLGALAGLPGRVEAGPPPLPNLVPMFPLRDGTYANNFVVTAPGGVPRLEFEILTSNIGGQDWIRPPIDRTDCCGSFPCHSGNNYFRMPQTHEYRIYWYDPDQLTYVLISNQRKTTLCIQDDAGRGRDVQNYCLADGHTGITFPCGCISPVYGAGKGNGVSMGWSDSYFRGLTGQWAIIGDYVGDFVLTVEVDPDQVLQAADLFDYERDATHDDNISYVYFSYAGGTGSVDPVQVVYGFDPVCTF